MNIGERIFRLVQQNQEQWDTQTCAGQCQQQGINLAARGERQGVGDAQAHQPEVANEKAGSCAAEDTFRALPEA